jgi:hypothetical protein
MNFCKFFTETLSILISLQRFLFFSRKMYGELVFSEFLQWTAVVHFSVRIVDRLLYLTAGIYDIFNAVIPKFKYYYF